jgi:hypothetical protein
VDGHHLDGIRACLDPAEVETPFLVDGRVEPGEEPAQRRAVGARGEGGGDVGEGVEVRAGGTGRPARPGEDLDVEPQRDLRLRGELREAQTRERAQPSHRGRKSREPVERDGPDRLTLRAEPGGGG